MDLTRRCVNSPTHLETLQEDWDELVRLSATGSPFCSYAWCVSWWRTFGQGWQPEVYVWEHHGRVVALLPLMRRRRFGLLRELSFLNGPEVAPEQLDVLSRPEVEDALRPALHALLRELRRNCDLWVFRDLDPAGLLLTALYEGRSPDDLQSVAVASPPQAGVRIDGDFDAYFATRGPKVRRNYRHSCRAFKTQFGVEAQALRPNSPAQALACFESLWRLHRMSFERRGEFDYFGTGRVEQFHRAVLSHAGALGMVRFVILGNESLVLASAYCLVHRARMCCYQIGFDPEVEKLSPGFVTIGSAINLAFEEGCTYFDFLRGDESYKQRWATATHHTITYTRSMGTIVARIRHAAVAAIDGARKIKRALRPARRSEPA